MTTAPRPATAEDVLGKPLRTHKFTLNIERGDGSEQVEMHLRALAGTKYDELMAAHPPTKEQKEIGETFNPETFAPALISKVLTAPELTEEQAVQLWKSDTWSRGELMDLYLTCLNLCARGLDVPFTPAG